VRLNEACSSLGAVEPPLNTVHATVTAGCNSIEQRLGKINGLAIAASAGIDDLRLVGGASVADGNVLAAERVQVGVNAVLHHTVRDGDNGLILGVGPAARAQARSVVCDVASVG